MKELKKKGGIYVDEDEEVNMHSQNVMGSGKAISQKELSELHQKLADMQRISDNTKTDLSIQAN